MERRAQLGIVSLVAVILAAVCMQAETLRIGAVAPHALLAVYIVVSFFSENPVFYGLLALIGSALLRFTPTLFDEVALATLFLAALIFLVQRRVVWPGVFGTLLLVLLGVLANYLVLEPSFIVNYPMVVAGEILYTVVLSLGLYEIYRFFFAGSSRA
jgi:hypothetical protein